MVQNHIQIITVPLSRISVASLWTSMTSKMVLITSLSLPDCPRTSLRPIHQCSFLIKPSLNRGLIPPYLSRCFPKSVSMYTSMLICYMSTLPCLQNVTCKPQSLDSNTIAFLGRWSFEPFTPGLSFHTSQNPQDRVTTSFNG